MDGVGQRRGIEPGAGERRYIQPQRPVADTADAEHDFEAAPVLVERDLGGGRHESKIRTPRADFEKTGADALVRPDRKADRVTHSPCPIEVSIGPMKKSSAGIDAGPSGVASRSRRRA